MKNRLFAKSLLSLVTVFFVIVACAGLCMAADPVLSAKLEMAGTMFKAKDSINIKYTLTNISDKAVYVLKWHTPLEGFYNDIFNIVKDGKRVGYIGPMVKRGMPTPDDYIMLKPGESANATLDLATAYEIYDTGQYSVQMAYDILDAKWANGKTLQKIEAFNPVKAQASTVMFILKEGRKAIAPKPIERGVKGVPVFKNCSGDQQQTLTGALSSAQWIALVADTALRTTPMDVCPSARRYATWFGAYDANRYTTVWDDFDKIRDALENKTMTFNCDCNKDAYAYVHPNSPYEIYLCKAFWPAPMNGTDSKAGTIVHETSHFTVVAGTKDNAYGQTACQKLAKDDPARAINNADSHEYFAEDTPPIPMP